jgi:hypothetical protein
VFLSTLSPIVEARLGTGWARNGNGRKEKGPIRTALLACSGIEVSSLYVFVPVVAPFSNALDMMGMLDFP